MQFPHLVNKYSLMPYSLVSQVFLNDRFVIVQSSSMDGNNQTYNYTWIMNRGDRTYTQAFKVIKHGTARTFVDFNEQFSYLLILDDFSLVNYAFEQATLILRLKADEDMFDRIMNFTIKATSADPSSDTNASCALLVNFTLLEDNNRTMWPIGDAPPTLYNANYPGKVKIELAEYVIGPNVTYRIKETEKGQLPGAKVYQEEQMVVEW